MLWGVASGLLAAFFHSVNYLFSRRYVLSRDHTSLELFALSHVWMAVLSAGLVPLLYDGSCPSLSAYRFPLLASSAFYLLGQLALFTALRRAEASRISPLLGLKILMLALITVSGLPWPSVAALLRLAPLRPLQWAAVAASLTAALIQQQSGTRLSPKTWLLVLAACLFYSLSDLSIGVVVRRLAPMGALRGSLYGCALTYLLNGAVGGAVLAVGRKTSRQKWMGSLPVAATWLLAMFFLYMTFQAVGVLFGNILQSTRGLISVALGLAIGGARWAPELEQQMTRSAFARRMAAAVLMTAAVATYLISVWSPS